MGQYVIGVDGGGTKTLGALADMSGNVLAQTEVGSTNHHSNPMEVVHGNLGSLITSLLGTAGVQAGDVACICLGMAGVDRPEDKPMIQNMVAEFLPVATCIPVNDGVIALVGGALKPFGVIVISGTGSIAFGLNEAGERARAGGWGHVLGDEGSGYDMSIQALHAVMQAHDGRIAPTILQNLILDHLKLERPDQLLAWIKEIQAAKAEIATLSRLVFEASESGDAAAQGILLRAADDLAIAAGAVGTKLFAGATNYEVIVAGGNLRKNAAFYTMFEQALAKRLPGIKVIQPRKEPVEGAVLHAINSLKTT